MTCRGVIYDHVSVSLISLSRSPPSTVCLLEVLAFGLEFEFGIWVCVFFLGTGRGKLRTKI